jgi:hypothetical protein
MLGREGPGAALNGWLAGFPVGDYLGETVVFQPKSVSLADEIEQGNVIPGRHPAFLKPSRIACLRTVW